MCSPYGVSSVPSFFEESYGVYTQASLLGRMEVAIFVLIPSMSIISFFSLRFYEVQHTASPIASPSSPCTTPLSLGQHAVSSVMSSPVPTSSGQILDPGFLGGSSIFSVIDSAHALKAPRMAPRVHSPCYDVLSHFLSTDIHEIPKGAVTEI